MRFLTKWVRRGKTPNLSFLQNLNGDYKFFVKLVTQWFLKAPAPGTWGSWWVLASAGDRKLMEVRGKSSTWLSTGQAASLGSTPLTGFTCPSAPCSKSRKSDVNKHLTATSGPSLFTSVLLRAFQFWIGSWNLLLFCSLFESRMLLKGTCGKTSFPNMVLFGGGRNFKEWEVFWLLGSCPRKGCHLSFLYFASPTPGGGIASPHASYHGCHSPSIP